MKVHRNERGITSPGAAIILIFFVAMASIIALVSIATAEDNSVEKTVTATEITVTVTAEPLVSGSTTLITFFTFPPAPERIGFTESVTAEFEYIRFQIRDAHDIDWVDGFIVFYAPLES